MGQAVGLGIQRDAQLRGGKWEKVHSTLTILLGWGGGIARSTRSATEPASLTSQRRGVDLPSGAPRAEQPEALPAYSPDADPSGAGLGAILLNES